MTDPIDVGVDHFDQAHAEALERLRTNRIGFILATMTPDTEMELIVCIPDHGDGTLFEFSLLEVARALAVGAIRSHTRVDR